MANEMVKFKKGLHASLPQTAANIEVGTFYLTTDTDRLYVGQLKDNVATLVELNKSITAVATTSNLPDTGVAIGQFYYVSGSNILCYYDGDKSGGKSGWVQINPDTILTADNYNTSIAQATTNKSATVTTSVSDSKNHTSTGTYTIVGGDNLNVVADATNRTITLTPDLSSIQQSVDTTYTLTTGGTANATTINLNDNRQASDPLDNDTLVTIVGAEAARTSQANGTITVTVDQPVAVTDMAFDDTTGVLTTTVQVNNQNYTAGTATPVIKLGNNADEYKFLGVENNTSKGVATLPVYTKTEVDDMIEDAMEAVDAMTFLGTVSSSDASSKLTTGKNVGDTYKASGHIDAANIPGSVDAAETGDLLIAVGDNDGAVTWVVVPSGNDQTIQGSVGALSMEISDQSSELAGVTFVPGNHIALAGDGTSSTTHTNITVSQAQDYTAQVIGAASGNTVTPGTKTQAGAGVTPSGSTVNTITYLTGIQTDAYGNVVNGSVKAETLTLVDTHNTAEAVVGASVDNGVATVSIDVANSDGTTTNAESFSLHSETLTISEGAANTTNEIHAELLWGSF